MVEECVCILMVSVPSWTCVSELRRHMCVPLDLCGFLAGFLCMHVILANFQVCVCVCCCHSVFSHKHVLYGHRMEAAHFPNVCGSPVFWEFCVWCACRWKAAPFCICVCVPERVCVWCGQRLKGALVHMGTNDRICLSKPICKKMKETKLVKIRAETLPDLPRRFHCSVRWSVDGHQFCYSVPLQRLWATKLVWLLPLLRRTWHKGARYKANLGPVQTDDQTKTTKLPLFAAVTAYFIKWQTNSPNGRAAA